MQVINTLDKILEQYSSIPFVQNQLRIYFEKNIAARKSLEVYQAQNWDYKIDHLTIRTYDVEKAAEAYIELGWQYDELIEYKSEGWWAKTYRKENFPTMFIDQSYPDAPKDKLIVKKWVDKFSDQEFHHIAVRVPEDQEIEKAIELIKAKDTNFPGTITGSKGSQLRQIFSQAELIDGAHYSVLELVERNADSKTGKLYFGFINDQADSLMKDSTL
jgi:hypothetical protein